MQTPLFIRWEHRAHWPALQQAYGGNEVTSAIILSLTTASGPVSYSRNRNHYVRPRRYKDPLYTYAKVTQAVDYLSGAGLIHHDKMPPNHRGWQSWMSATAELTEGTNKIVLAGPPLVRGNLAKASS